MGLAVKDASLIETVALPGSATSVYSDGFDVGPGPRGDHLSNVELLIEAPALATADLGDGATMKYTVQMDDNSSFSTPTTVIVSPVLTQTGAGGAGAAAASVRLRLPVDIERYIRVQATNSAAGDASDKSMTVTLLF